MVDFNDHYVNTSSRNGCYNSHRLSKASLLASMDQTSRMREILSDLDDAQWRIASFNPRTGIVCVQVDSGKQVNLMAIGIKHQ